MEVVSGLANIYACDTKISSIIDDQLAYAGYSIQELITNDASFEEVIYLLWYLRLPNREELDAFKQELNERSVISGEVEACLRIQTRQNLHPMSVLRTTVSLLGVFDPYAEENTSKSARIQGMSIQAKIPTIVAAFSRLRKGLNPIQPRADLNFSANFLYMLTGEEPTATQVKALNQALVLHADHELNASTFAARVSASTLSDVYSCITTAIGTLKGPLHGGANERVFEMLEAINANGTAAEYLQKKLDSKEKIMGFGHRVYKTVDPRQSYLKEMAFQLTKDTENEKWYDISVEVEDYIRNARGLIPNVDFYSATVYHVLGIESDLFTLIFAISRVSGWLAHVKEQRENNSLIRPRSRYIGPLNQVYLSIDQRS